MNAVLWAGPTNTDDLLPIEWSFSLWTADGVTPLEKVHSGQAAVPLDVLTRILDSHETDGWTTAGITTHTLKQPVANIGGELMDFTVMHVLLRR